ncbi:MAG: hypothetical protein ACRELB_01000, partial [Polyangiaceae bacterium]
MTKSRANPASPPAEDDAASETHATTVRPPFDPEAFARESESNIRVDTQPPSKRPTTPPAANLPQYAAGLTSGTMVSLGSVSSDAIPMLAVARDDLEWFDLSGPVRELLA